MVRGERINRGRGGDNSSRMKFAKQRDSAGAVVGVQRRAQRAARTCEQLVHQIENPGRQAAATLPAQRASTACPWLARALRARSRSSASFPPSRNSIRCHE